MRLDNPCPFAAPAESGSAYTVRLAQSQRDVRAAVELRSRVFQQDLEHRDQRASELGLEEDSFDLVCDHILVEHKPSGQIIGTSRLQPGARARVQLGFHAATEFELGAVERLWRGSVELGRACLDLETLPGALRNQLLGSRTWADHGSG